MLLTALLLTSMPPVCQDPDLALPPPEYTVTLTPQAPAAGSSLRWSPKGAKVDLHADGEALTGRFALGPPGAPAVRVRLERNEGQPHYDVLSIDLDRNDAFTPLERLTTTPKEQRGKWWSSFATSVPVPFPTPTDATATVPYPLSLWFVADPQEPDAPPALRWSRRGWHEGTVVVGDVPVFVLITEMSMDGVFTTADAWALAHDRKSLLDAPSRSLRDHCWLAGQAYRAIDIAADGRQLTFAACDPGTTEAAEQAAADIYRVDREAKRATTPLVFAHDLPVALAEARTSNKRVLIDFETTWCGPCKLMNQWVYTAADVTAAAADVIAVKLDGDVERELTRRFAVTAYPTMLLLDANGKEVRRAVGYRGVAAMVQFLAK